MAELARAEVSLTTALFLGGTGNVREEALKALRQRVDDMLKGKVAVRLSYEVPDDSHHTVLSDAGTESPRTLTPEHEDGELSVLYVRLTGEPNASALFPSVLDSDVAPAPQLVEVHVGISCDGCWQTPIVGRRFRCLEGSGRDLCERCFHRNRAEASEHQHRHYQRMAAAAHVHLAEDPAAATLALAPLALPAAHGGIFCNACGQRPIVGSRFECRSQRGYDLCAACHARRAEFSPHCNQPFDEFVMRPGIAWSTEQTWTSMFANILAPTTPPAPKSMADPEAIPNVEVHLSATCDGCRDRPIVGRRFQSLGDPDFDLCERCFFWSRVEAPRHAHSTFWRVEARKRIHIKGYIPSQGRPGVHKGFFCDVCKKDPIVGSRFKCKTQEGYDLCQSCFVRRMEVSVHGREAFEELVVRVGGDVLGVGDDVITV